jgi:uncharacterized protein DUF262
MTIQQFVNHFEKGQLNLEPGFQRNSVWSLNDRAALIESIFLNYPMPSVFLYKRQDVDGDLIYDVIDGKQRLESIFMFMGLGYFRRDRYWAWTKLSPKDEEADWYDWAKVRRKDGEYAFSSYRIQIGSVDPREVLGPSSDDFPSDGEIRGHPHLQEGGHRTGSQPPGSRLFRRDSG